MKRMIGICLILSFLIALSACSHPQSDGSNQEETAAHGVSSAQVIIRRHLQAGNICIPGSSNEQHIIEDYDVWDFELTEEEMLQMTALERDDRFADF